MRAISIGYHDVLDDAGALQSALPRCNMQYTLDRQDFRNHLLSIREQEAQIGTIQRFRRWEEGTPVFLTFDDGALSAYTCVANELEQHNWRAHFLITTDWIGRSGFLDRRQIRDLRDRGHIIGSHSCSHPARMSHLEWGELVGEWAYSCAVLSDILGERVIIASVPNGYYSQKVGRAAAAAGIEVLFTSEPTAVTSVLDGCLILGRYWIQRYTPSTVSGTIAAGQIWPRWRQSVLWEVKKAVKALTGESYLAIRRYLILRAIPNRAGDSPPKLGTGFNRKE